MALTEKDALYIAELAHLELTQVEIQKFLPQLASILEYMEQLNRLDTTNVEPMAQVTYPASANPALRDDVTGNSLGQQVALANAPEPGAGCFKVPRVIERE